MLQNQYLQKTKTQIAMQSAAENSKTWNDLVDWYDQTFMNDKRYKSCYDHFLQLLGTNVCSVLELGCGPGNVAKYMLEANKDLSWTGIDYAPAMVERAQQNCPSAEFITLDAREIKTWRRKFDALMLGFCLPYFSPAELCDYLPAWVQRVNAEGLVYLSFVEGEPSNSGTQVNRKGYAIDFYYYKTETIKQACKDCGLSIVYEEQVSYPRPENKIEYHTILIGKKTAVK